jgi:hypothetical protein
MYEFSAEAKGFIQPFRELAAWLQTQQLKQRIFDPVFMDHLVNGLKARNHDWTVENSQNTYLRKFEVPQIVLFDILANRFPLVIEAQKTATRHFVKQAAGARHLCILDIGIGRGMQMIRLLKSLEHLPGLETINLIGIEISKPAMDHAAADLASLQAGFGVGLEYKLLNAAVESLRTEELLNLLPTHRDRLLVNASLTLHHIQEMEDRRKLFIILKQLNPNLLVIIEPNADTFTEHTENRMINAAQHFSALYDYVNTLSLFPEEIKSLKTFFANDFFDPMAIPNAHRFEKLTRSETWSGLLRSAAFIPAESTELLVSDAIENIDIAYPEPGVVSFSFGNTPLLSILGFR